MTLHHRIRFSLSFEGGFFVKSELTPEEANKLIEEKLTVRPDYMMEDVPDGPVARSREIPVSLPLPDESVVRGGDDGDGDKGDTQD